MIFQPRTAAHIRQDGIGLNATKTVVVVVTTTVDFDKSM